MHVCAERRHVCSHPNVTAVTGANTGRGPGGLVWSTCARRILALDVTAVTPCTLPNQCEHHMHGGDNARSTRPEHPARGGAAVLPPEPIAGGDRHHPRDQPEQR